MAADRKTRVWLDSSRGVQAHTTTSADGISRSRPVILACLDTGHKGRTLAPVPTTVHGLDAVAVEDRRRKGAGEPGERSSIKRPSYLLHRRKEQSEAEMAGVAEDEGADDRLGESKREAEGGTSRAVVAGFRAGAAELEGAEPSRTDLVHRLDVDTVGRWEAAATLGETVPLLAQNLHEEVPAIFRPEEFGPIALPAPRLGMSRGQERRGGLPDLRATEEGRLPEIVRLTQPHQQECQFSLAESEAPHRIDGPRLVAAEPSPGIDRDMVDAAITVLVGGDVVGMGVGVAEGIGTIFCRGMTAGLQRMDGLKIGSIDRREKSKPTETAAAEADRAWDSHRFADRVTPGDAYVQPSKPP